MIICYANNLFIVLKNMNIPSQNGNQNHFLHLVECSLLNFAVDKPSQIASLYRDDPTNLSINKQVIQAYIATTPNC